MHSQGSVLQHVKGQQSSPELVASELFQLGYRQGAAARHRPESASAEGGHERLRLSYPPLPGGCILELHASAASRPGALRMGGQPVAAQPGRPLWGAPVDRPHRLPPAERRRHLLHGQEVFGVEVSFLGSQRQHYGRVSGRGGQELQGSGAAGPDRLSAGQKPVHQVRYSLYSNADLLPKLLVHLSISSTACCAHRTLAEYCPKLQSLRVNHCHNVTESSLDPLRKRNVVIDVEPPLQRALVLLQDVLGFAPFINLQI